MPIRDPRRCRDKTADWMAFFAAARRAELTPLVTSALLAEHAEDPRGGESRHSAALQDVLNYAHGCAIDGKSFVYAEIPNERYVVGTLHGRGIMPTLRTDTVFASEREAVHAVFLERLAHLGLLSGTGGRP